MTEATDRAAILDELHWRGLIANATDEDALRAAFAAGPLTFYIGFDPTAPSLHIGNLVQIMTMRRVQRAGNSPLALVGGATGLIGDPSGKSAERVLNSGETVATWVRRIRSQIEPFLDFSGEYAARMVDNLEWTGSLSAIDLLRDVGKHFPVNRMLDRESVRARLEAGGLSYTEFSYQLLQAHDYLQLHQRYGCTLQMGGSDQWGNMTAGVDLIRRVTSDHVGALATPLVTKADGTKFGKTESGTIWLDPQLTSPYAFYQFWIGADDRDVVPYLKIFTDRTRDEIDELEKSTADRPSERAAARVLAADVTALVHGSDECARVMAASRALFGQGSLESLDERTLTAALTEAPHATLPAGQPLPTVAELLALTGLSPSRSAARRVVAEGGCYLNNARVTDPDSVPEQADFLHGRWLVLRRGKRAVAGVEVAP
ncbi:MAG TPA: tyrosine--tRNA ligase [Acidothermales bacterium]